MGESITKDDADTAAGGWHHCGRCGAFFSATPGEGSLRPCPECGRHPAPDYDAWQRKQTMQALAGTAAEIPQAPPLIERDEEPGQRKRRRSRFVGKLISGWLIFLAVVVVSAKIHWRREEAQGRAARSSTLQTKGSDDADSLLISHSIHDCQDTVNGFLQTAAPESRAQFVLDPVDAARRLSRSDTLSPLTAGESVTSRLLAHVIHTPRGPGIETIWQTSEDRKIEAVLFQDQDVWKIDWQAMLRYSDQSWVLFLAGSGEAEGEFRLLARERLQGERSQHSQLSVVFYMPRFGAPRDVGNPSPEFLVDKSSRDGRLLAATFDARANGQGAFQSQLIAGDPEDLIRVRVRVKRRNVEGEQKFVLEQVVACHWLSLDDPGYDMPKAPQPEPQTSP